MLSNFLSGCASIAYGLYKGSKCSVCNGRVVYYRPYSGERLCPSCFKASILEKTRRTISRYGLLKHGDRIAVAVSGGKDSLSLLYVLKELCEDHGSQLHAVTIDEGVKGYRDEAISIAERVTSELKVPHSILSFKELYGITIDEALASKDRKITSCTVCGILRRRAMDMAAQRIDANVLATAHNLDDFLQTFIINLLNGDLKRIRWLDPVLESKGEYGIRRVKPFMEIYEEEIAFYAYLQNLPFQSFTCPYMGESIRSEIRSILNRLEAAHPGVKYNTLKAVIGITQSLVLEGEVKTKCEACGYPSSNNICSVCETLRTLKVNIQI